MFKQKVIFRPSSDDGQARGSLFTITFNGTVRSVLLCGCETWSLRSGDANRLQVFHHRCVCSIGYFFVETTNN